MGKMMNRTIRVILASVILMSLAATQWDFSFISEQSQALIAADPDEQRSIPR